MNRSFAHGEIIFKEGDKGEYFYEVIDGTVGIYVDLGTPDEKKLSEVEAGHFFGELAIIDSLPRSAAAVALSDVTVEMVSPHEMEAYFISRPDRIKSLITELGARIVRLTGQNTEVRQTLKAAVSDDASGKSGIMDKLKKYARDYSIAKKQATVSAETKRAQELEKTGEGFGKTVDDYRKGKLIFREGETSHCMYYIHTGWVDVYVGYGQENEKKINTVGVGMFLGEIGLISDKPRTASAVAGTEHTMIESFGLDDFEEMFEKNPMKVRLLVDYFAERIRTLTNEYVEGLGLAFELSQASESGADTAAVNMNINKYLKK